jgi:hypothetical protein
VGQDWGAEATDTRIRLPGHGEVNALREAFPTRVSAVDVIDGEWAVRVDDVWYLWAEGRLLPPEQAADWEEYVPIRFYSYDPGPWRPREISPALESRLRDYTRRRDSDRRVRFNGFLDQLYGIRSRREADQTMRPVEFLGMRTTVHPLVIEPLARVERRIRTAMLHDQATRSFVQGLAQVHGYNWRNIAGTRRRSYHAYGMAVDLIPRSWNGQWGYWRWAADGGVSEWWELSYEERWTIPQRVVDAFEAEGFVWGGKWLFFDNVHFEYRPEVMVSIVSRFGD